MITLKSIRIRNFRAIRSLTFTPEENGITGIFGVNGAGKSSVLAGVMFALYGIVPKKGATVQSLRNRNAPANAECSVSVVFTHLGQTIEVVREIKKSSTVANIYVDGAQDADVKTTAPANKWIRKRLGVDAEGFMTAFVVRQKELDEFITATAGDRKDIIERLAGVDTIKAALKSAREKKNDTGKILANLPGSQEQVDAAAAEVDYFLAESEQTAEQLEKLRAYQATGVAKRNELTAFLESQQTHQEAHQGLVMRRAQAESAIPLLEEQRGHVAYVEKLEESGDTVESLRARYAELTASINTALEERSALESERQKLSSEAKRLGASVQQMRDALPPLKEAASSTEEELKERTVTEAEKRQSVQEERAILVSVNADMEESLKLLAGNDDCPTCKTTLQDPEALKKRFQGIIDGNTKVLATLETAWNELDEELQSISAATDALAAFTAAQTTLNTTEAAWDETVELLAQMTGFTELDERIKQLRDEQAEVMELGSKASNYEKDAATFKDVSARLSDAQEAYQKLSTEILLLEEQFDPVQAQEASQRLKDINPRLDVLRDQERELMSKLNMEEQRLTQARSAHQRFYAQMEEKSKIQHAYASESLTTDTLEKFRREVVSSIAPELSDYATGFVSEMTEGAFTEIRLDEEFNASLVNAAGMEQPIHELSGGEESIVALALRLAVAFLISGGYPELLWLDEPLVSQDRDRRASILTLIRKLPINQILIINHAQEAADIVDYEITLDKESPQPDIEEKSEGTTDNDE